MLLLSGICPGQKRNQVWYGPYVALDFNTAAAPAFLPPPAIPSNGQPASICDTSGALLFYTNGNTVYGKDHFPMPHGQLLDGSEARFDRQPCSAVILPAGGSRYYLFSLLPDSFAVNLPAGVADTMIQPSLYYSMIDMSLNSGNGDIVAGSKKILMKSGLMRCLLLAAPGTGCDSMWVVVHEADAATFLSYPVTAAGIGAPVSSTAGVSYLADNRPGYGFYYGKLSPDVRKLALFSWRRSLAMPVDPGSYASLELLDFDRSTGAFSNAASLYENLDISPFLYGFFPMSFSPDSRKLYTVQRTDYDVATWNRVMQYDLSLAGIAAIRASEMLIGTVPPAGPGSSPFMTDMRLGPDSKIYVGCSDIFPMSTGGVIPLACIPAPDAAGTACGWVSGISSPLLKKGTPMLFPVPNVEPSGSESSSAQSLILCAQPLALGAGRSGSYLWNNGSIDSSITVTLAGTYWVRTRYACGLHTDTFHVLASPDLSRLLPPDTQVCAGSALRIELPAYPGVQYTWPDGSQGTNYTAGSSGTLMLSVHGPCGTITDTMRIAYKPCSCDYLFLPTAFSPNADGLNDLFLPRYTCTHPVVFYELRIYNRWGQLAFTSHTVTQGWDGTTDGYSADVGVYHYTVSLQSEGSGKELFSKGQVTLLR